MDLSVILRAVSSALMVAKTARLFQSAYKSSLSDVFLLFSLVFIPVILVFPLRDSASLSYSIRSLCWGCKNESDDWIQPPESPLIPEHFSNMLPFSCRKLSLASAAEECYFLLFLNLDLSFLLLPSLCDLFFGDYYVHCVRCRVGTAWMGALSL